MPPKAARDPRDTIEMLIDLAPKLHAAGFTSLAIDGVSVTLARPPAPVSTDAKPAAKPNPPPRQHIDPLRDPSTYPTGKVPGFTRDEDRERMFE